MYYRAILLLSCIGLVLAGCSGPQPLPVAPTPIPTLLPATLPAAPMPALPSGGALAAIAPPATGGGATDAAAILGQQVFENNCKACHRLSDEKLVGPGLAGLFERMPPLPSGQPFSEENLIAWIESGGKAMPSFASLSNEQLDAVVSYLKEATATGKKTEPAPTEEMVTAEPAGVDAPIQEAVTTEAVE